jgi:hypothetical protein
MNLQTSAKPGIKLPVSIHWQTFVGDGFTTGSHAWRYRPRASERNQASGCRVVPGVKRLGGRIGSAGLAVALVVPIIAACGSPAASGQSAVPPEFRPACGHPGTQVVARKVPVTVRHADCDLTGAAISYPGRGGATVPRDGGVTIGNSNGLKLTVHAATLDVTVDVTGPPGNAQA